MTSPETPHASAKHQLRRKSSSSIAVIAVEGIVSTNRRLFAREVSIAYMDDRPTLAWLVWPERRWESMATVASEALLIDGNSGLGVSPKVVADALTTALDGCKVFADFHLVVNKWLKELYLTTGNSMPFLAHDYRKLIMPNKRMETRVQSKDVEDAGNEAYRQFPISTRASQDAARHVCFAKLMATKV